MIDTLAAGWKPEGVSSALVFVVLAATYIVFDIVYSLYDVYLGPLSKFPGPKLRAFSKLPAIWTLLTGSESVEYPALHARYGPIVRIAPQELSYAGGATALRDIYGFKKSGEPYHDKDRSFYRKPVNQVDSVISADDATHSRQRKIISHSFADKTLRGLEPMLKEWVGKLKDKLQEKSGEKVDLLKFYNCCTFDIMADLTFSECLDMLDNGEYSDWVKAIFQGIKSDCFTRAIKKTSPLADWAVDNILMKTPEVTRRIMDHWNHSKQRVDRRLEITPARSDLWTRILDKSKGPEALTLDEHHSLASLFMIAGTETTATALSGTTYWLLKNPDCMKKLTSEIHAIHERFEDITLDSIQHLKYLHAVLQEGLRMYPPVPSTMPRRVAAGGAVIDGEWVPGNTVVGVHQLSNCRNEANFKNPYEFHPERWLHDPEYKDDNLNAMEPFSVGPRNCVGKNLAWHEMRLLLVTVLWHFDLQLSEESSTWHEQKIFNLWDKAPLVVKVVARTP